MKNKNTKLSIVLLFVLGLATQAQQAIAASGGNAIGAGGSAPYSIGQMAYTYNSGTGGSVSQGVQQVYDFALAIQLSPQAYIQGASINPNTGEGTLMRDDLRVAGSIPTTSPYADALTCDASVFTPTGADAIVDWVLVELRDGNNSGTVLYSRSALLQRDGDIVDVDGVSPVSIAAAASDYFVAVNHRNHLGVLSASTISLSSTNSVVDFTSSSASAAGGANALTDLGNGIYATFGGDYDANAQVQNTDASGVTLLIGGAGYSAADTDINNQVQNTDLQNLINPNIGRGQQFSKTAGQSRGSSLLAPGITLTFDNAEITNDGTNDYYEADVFITGSEDFKLGSGQFYINYNPAAFGPDVSANGRIEFTRPAGSILGGVDVIVGAAPVYTSFIQNDNTTSRVSFSFQQAMSAGAFADNVTTTAALLCHLKMTFIDLGEPHNIAFEDGPVYLDQFFTACGPFATGFTFADCSNEQGDQILDDTFDSSGAVIDGLSTNGNELVNITMYPNPVENAFYVDGLQEAAKLSIYDMKGRLVHRQDRYLGTAIKMEAFTSGVYLVKIENINGASVKRLIKE